ncbi:class I SAM-dependent methyltransferase [Microcoleus sp. AR_TQ3_B6]|uniref:class I SAM-dependent methyltransferase n=1 Tax=Microcoleus sp. AR_TQ3_B6 TaxID=3055284 RepID=UPI002FD639D5
MSNQGYIKGSLTLISDRAADLVLDFGGGIGTHAMAAALCPQVEQVVYCDLDPINYNFVQSRPAKLGFSDKISCWLQLSSTEFLEAIICLDVMEYLLNSSQQLIDFYQRLAPLGKIFLNWYLFKDFNQ